MGYASDLFQVADEVVRKYICLCTSIPKVTLVHLSSWPSVDAIEKKVEQFLSAVISSERLQQHFHNTIQQRTSIQTNEGGNALSEEEIMKERDAAKVRGDKVIIQISFSYE